MKEVLEKLNGMSEVFFICLVLFEDLVIIINNLEILLKKVFVDDVKGFSMENGVIKFKLFVDVGDMGGVNINVKVRRLLLVFLICFICYIKREF